MHVLHVPAHQALRVAAFAAALALLITVAFMAAAERLGAGSSSQPATPAAAPITATPAGDPPAWVADPLAPPTILLAN